MRVVSIGDLVTDYYYKNGELLGVSGGMTSHNIIANLSKLGIKTAAFGVCGNDDAGMISIKSLEDLKVDVSNVKVLDNVSTRCFHVSYFDDKNGLSFTSKKRCPFCNNKKWYDESLIDCGEIAKKIQTDDILIFDNLNLKNQKIIDSLPNKKIIDIGQYFEFENLTNLEIIEKLKSKFVIINFNERVSNYLIKRLNLQCDLDIFKLLQPEFMTITRGDNGARFIYNDNIFDFTVQKKAVVVDSTGAGDAFISSIIKDWINNNLKFETSKFNKWYQNSNKLTFKVVNKMGARGHLRSLYKIKKIDDYCTCEKFTPVFRKQIKRCNININNLKSRLKNAINSNAVLKLNNINFNELDSYLFIGTGGSFAGAYFASTVINNLYGSNTYAFYPRDVIYRNNKRINKVILFSYSGTTDDIINSVSTFANEDKYIITKGETKKIVLKTGIKKDNILSYRSSSNKGKERGFLSFEGAVAPAAIFLKYYYNQIDPQFDLELFIDESIEYWNKYYDGIFSNTDIKDIIFKGNVINIFKGDFCNSACYDLESKIIESGILNCIIHEKKNFSHGRFINYENLNNKNTIYFKQKTTSKYEEKLLEYLKTGKNLILESKYDGLLCEFDLLIASQLLIYFIGKFLNVDVSKPEYSEDSMKIYFYKGEL